MNERTKRPIRVFHGLDVHDLPPETPARRPGKHATDQPLEMFAGQEASVTIAGQRRMVAVEGDALAADRLWSALATAEATIEELRAAAPKPTGKTFTLAEVKAAFMKYLDVRSDRRPSEDDKLNSWALLCSEAGLLLLGTDTLPEPKALTPREREPAIWASAFGAFFVRALDAAYSATDAATPRDRMAATLPLIDEAACARVADAAVLAAEGTSAPEPGETPRTKEPGWRSP